MDSKIFQLYMEVQSHQIIKNLINIQKMKYINLALFPN